MQFKNTVLIAFAVATSFAAPAQQDDPGVTATGSAVSDNQALTTSTMLERRERKRVPPKWALDSDFVAANDAVCLTGVDPFNFNGGFTRAYYVHIGRYFNGGFGCSPVSVTIEKHVNNNTDEKNFWAYTCEDDDHYGTLLTFNIKSTPDTNADDQYRVIEGLQEAYPMVPFTNNSICLVGHPAPDTWKKPDPKMSRRDEVDPWGNLWAPGSGPLTVPTTTEDPLHMFAAKTGVDGVMGYDLQIHISYDPNTVCDYLHGTLQQAATINEWGCMDDTLGGTAVKFTAVVPSYETCQPQVYEKLNQAYPELDVLGKRPAYPSECEVPSWWPATSSGTIIS